MNSRNEHDGVPKISADRSLGSKTDMQHDNTVADTENARKSSSISNAQGKLSMRLGNHAHAPSQSTPTTPVSEPPPDGGYGWVIVACAFTVNAHTWGINSSYGIFLNHYLTTSLFPDASYLQYAFVGSLSISIALLISPIPTITTREFGTRFTLLLGTLLEAISLISASFATQTWHLFLSQGVCFGAGMGFLFVGTVGLTSQWFTTKRSFANGIAAAGSGFGGLTYSLASAAMIRTIGLPWTFRVLGLLALAVNGTCSLLLRDRNAAVGASQMAFDARLFRRLEYLLLLAFGWFSMLAYVVLLFSLANYAATIGLSAQQASVVSAVLNLGQGLGRPPIGFFSDAVGRINMALMMTGLAGLLALVVWIPAKVYGVLIFYALAGGAVAGTFWAVVGPVTAEVVGLKQVPSALNLIWLVLSIPCTFSEPIGLGIVGYNGGSYLGAQVFVGVMYLAAAACLVFLRGWKIGEIEAIADATEMDPREINAVKAEQADDAVRDAARSKGRRSMGVGWFKWRKV